MNENSPKKSTKDNILVLVVVLVVIAGISAGILAIVDSVTREPRIKASLKATVAAFKELQPDFTNEPVDEEINIGESEGKLIILPKGTDLSKYGSSVITFYPARENGKLISVLAKTVSPQGYGGNITILVAMRPNGALQNVVVTDNNETPGLGTAVFSRKVQKTIWGILNGEYNASKNALPPNEFLDFFQGKEYIANDKYHSGMTRNIIPDSKWKVEKDGGDFKYITGATITSRAITFGVEKIVSAYYSERTTLLKVFKYDDIDKVDTYEPSLKLFDVNPKK